MTNFAVATLICVLVAACGGSGPTPAATLNPFLNAWSRGNWAAMRRLVAHPPADFVAINAAAFRGLGVTHATFTAGPVVQSASGDQAAATVTAALHGAADRSLRAADEGPARQEQAHGQVAGLMVTRTINPHLGPRESLAVNQNWPKRAPILGAGGVSLTTTGSVVAVGLVGERIKDPAAVKADLILAGATAVEIDPALVLAKAHPTQFEPVFTVSKARFAQLKAAGGPHNVYAVPGMQFDLQTARQAITPAAV